MPVRISTAEQLLEFRPGITVVRDRIGVVDGVSAPPSAAGVMVVHMSASVGEESPGLELQLVARPSYDVDPDTTLRLPLRGGVDALEVVRPGALSVDRVLGVARAAIELFDAYLRLPEQQREEFSHLPYGNAKVFDWMRPVNDTVDALESVGASPGLQDGLPAMTHTATIARKILLEK